MYETKSAQETLRELNVDPKQGLSTEEAGQRIAQYGLNKLAEKKKKPLILVFLSNFNDPMIFILIAAAILSLAIVFFNAGQEAKESGQTFAQAFDPWMEEPGRLHSMGLQRVKHD